MWITPNQKHFKNIWFEEINLKVKLVITTKFLDPVTFRIFSNTVMLKTSLDIEEFSGNA